MNRNVAIIAGVLGGVVAGYLVELVEYQRASERLSFHYHRRHVALTPVGVATAFHRDARSTGRRRAGLGKHLYGHSTPARELSTVE